MLKTRIGLIVAMATFTVVGCDDAPAETDGGAMDGAVSSCATGETDCSGECADLRSDRDHCGACGTVCGAGEACNAGSCETVCPSGQDVCGAGCFDLDVDRNHCGDCATSCGAGEACASGSCELSCPSGFTICGGSCVNTDADPAYCGDCDTACATGEVCSAGACASSCGAGLTDCSGACVDVQNDPTHCGDCTTACATDTGASGICMAGGCRTVCDPGVSDCNADLGATGGDGCETSSATDVNNCGACGLACTLANATAGCAASACTVATCDTGYDDCDTDASNGCEVELSTDDNNCGVCGTICASSESCVAGSCIVPVGEDCSSVATLSVGTNTITWTATMADYITSTPSCGSGYAVAGPDVVLSYTATADEIVALTINKPASTRWDAIISTGTCGTLTPELDCISDFTATTMGSTFSLTAGQTAYVYVIDTTSGTNPLSNPLVVDLATTSCSTLAPIGLLPLSGSTATTLSPSFEATFATPVNTAAGIITLTGSMGTTYTYDLSTSPSAVGFSSSNTVMTITPGAFLPGEVVTVSWTGLADTTCVSPIASPTWSVTTPVPPCVPGTGGMVGSTITRFATGLSSTFSEYFVHADESPTGYVYVGGTLDLYRLPKAGGTVENVETLAGLASANEGYGMLIDGTNVYTIETTTTGTTGHFWRISDDLGSTWRSPLLDWVTFPMTPGDNFKSGVVDGANILLLTEEFSDVNPTEIWSIPRTGTAPVTPTLAASFAGEEECSGIAVDDNYYYLGCWQNDRLVRVDRTTLAITLVTDVFDMQLSRNELYSRDLDADGTADVLYVQTDEETVYYVCEPDSATPYIDTLATWGTGSGNYGLGFDRTANTLWAFDDDTREFIRIQ